MKAKMCGPACNRCMERVDRVGGKAMVCIACQDAKAKCKQPGEKSREKKVRMLEEVGCGGFAEGEEEGEEGADGAGG